MKGWDHAIVFDPEGKVIYIIKLRMIPYRYVIVISILFHFFIFTFHFAINYSLAQEKGETLLGQGKELLDKRDYSGALQVLLEAAAQGPENPEVYNYLGEAYYRLKRLDEAVVALKKGVTLKADYLPAHLGLGIVYEAMGNIEGAMSEFREVLKIGEGTSDLPEVKIARERLIGLEVEEHIKKGRELFNNKKFEEALAEISAGISKDSGNYVLHFMAGLTYKELGKPKDSFSAFKKVTGLQPKNPAAHFHIGDLHFRFGAYQEAIDEFREVVRLAPESKEGREAASLIEKSKERIKLRGYFEEASEAVKNERYEAAGDILQKILKIEPDNSFGLYNLGVVYFKTGRREDAIGVLKKSLELTPRDVKTRYQLAVVYHELERIDDAIAEYDRAAASESDIEEVKMARDKAEMLKKYVTAKKGAERIDVLLESGDIEAALKEAEAILSKEERNPEAHFMLGRIYMRKVAMEKSVASLKRAIAIKSDYWDAYILLGQVYELWKRYSDAAEVYRAVFTAAPKTRQGLLARDLLKAIEISVHFERAKGYMDRGDLDGALKEIKDILEKVPDNPVALYNAGILYDRLERYEDAEVNLRKAIEKNPDYVQAHLQLALVYQSTQRFTEAEEEFRAVLSITQEGKEANIAKMRLGMIGEEEALSAHLKKANQMVRNGDYVGAKEELETVIAISPKNYMAYFSLGVILDRIDRREESIDFLKRAVEIKPDYAPGHFYLGQLYEKEDMPGNAREAYRKAATFGEGTRDGEIAALRLKMLRNWRIHGSMGHTLDSNISYGAERMVAMATGHELNFSYNLYKAETKGLTVNTSASRSLTYQNQLSNMTFGGNIGWSQQIRKGHSYGAKVSHTYALFEDKPSYRSYSYSINTSLSQSVIPTSLSFSYGFSTTASFINKVNDASSHSLSFSLSQAISPLDRISGSYSFSVRLYKEPEGSKNNSRSNTISFNYNRTIRPGLSAAAGYKIGLTDYINPDATTLFRQFRKNISQTQSADLTYRLSDNVSLSLDISNVHVTTNLAKPTAEERRKLEDILAEPVPSVSGGYKKQTVNLSIGVAF